MLDCAFCYRGESMKAIVRDRYGSADVLDVRDVPVPEVGDGEVLVRVRAAGLDRGAWHVMAGLPYLMRIAGYGLRRPKTAGLGSDVAGIVEAVGAKVTGVRPGEAVFGTCSASFAEYALARPGRPRPRTRPSRPARAGRRCLRGRRDLRRADRQGMWTNVAGVCSTSKVDLVRSIGADHVINYTHADITDDNQHYDLVLDIGGNRPLSQLRRVLTRDGTLVIVGGEGGGRWTGGIDRQLRAMALSPFVRQRLGTFIANENSTDLDTLRALIETSAVTPIIDRVIALHQVPDAIRDLAGGHVRGKIVIAT
jgi:NADPH:quinone reductase-like Zn-dependent oxidoreductase